MIRTDKIEYLGTLSKSLKLQERKNISFSFVLGWNGITSTITATNFIHPIKIVVKNEKKK